MAEKLIVIGRAPYNEHRLEHIYKGYKKQFIMKFASSKDFFKWLKDERITRPILGLKYLVEVTETEWVRDAERLIERYENFDVPYIDIVWYPEELRMNELLTSIEILDLRETYREDLLDKVMEDFTTDQETAMELIRRLRYRWSNYVLYRGIIKERYGDTLSPEALNLIDVSEMRTANEVLEMILVKRRFAVNAYENLQKRYSKTWVRNYLRKESEKLLKIKYRLAKGEMKRRDFRNKKEMRKYFYLVDKVTIPHLQTFIFLLNEKGGLGVYIWLNSTPEEILDYIREGSKDESSKST